MEAGTESAEREKQSFCGSTHSVISEQLTFLTVLLLFTSQRRRKLPHLSLFIYSIFYMLYANFRPTEAEV